MKCHHYLNHSLKGMESAFCRLCDVEMSNAAVKHDLRPDVCLFSRHHHKPENRIKRYLYMPFASFVGTDI